MTQAWDFVNWHVLWGHSRPTLLDARLDDQELSVRTINALANNGIVTIGQVIELDDYTLLRYPNFGRKCLRELQELLEDNGLQLSARRNTNPIGTWPDD